MGKRELFSLLNLSSWCLVMVEWLFLAVPWGCLRLVSVVFPNHTHLLFLACILLTIKCIITFQSFLCDLKIFVSVRQIARPIRAYKLNLVDSTK